VRPALLCVALVAPTAALAGPDALDPAAVAGEVGKHSREINACVDGAMKKTPKLVGELEVEFVVLPSGAVEGAHATRDSLGSPEFTACLTALINRWKTGLRPGAPARVAFPFVFSAADSAAAQAQGEQRGLSPEQVKQHVQAHGNEIRACFEAARRSQSKLAGKVTVSFTVGTDGRVSNARTREALGMPDLEGCLVRAVSAWKLDAHPSSPIDVSYPFTFQAD